MADNGHYITMPARFGPQNAKAVLGIMVRDALDETGKNLLRLILGVVFHGRCGGITSCTHAILVKPETGRQHRHSLQCCRTSQVHHIAIMCGRVIQSGGPVRYAIVDGMNVRDSRVHNYPPRWNAAQSQDLLVIRRNHQTGEVSLEPLRWGLIPYWCQDPKGGRKPINAKCETVRNLPTFRDAYRRRRCIVPVDGFFEWKAIKGQKAKQPYAIAMKDGSPFGLGGLWENWKEPASGEWIRTFAVITTDANELVAEIHDRMPLILAPGDYARWLSDEPDPREVMRPFPADSMRMWPISTRVNKPDNDDPSIVEPIELTTSAA
jgi:putative SOS response-associated peptidase YedK